MTDTAYRQPDCADFHLGQSPFHKCKNGKARTSVYPWQEKTEARAGVHFNATTQRYYLLLYLTCQSSLMGAMDSILSYLESNCILFILLLAASVNYVLQHVFACALVNLKLLALGHFTASAYLVLAAEQVKVIAFLEVGID